MSILTGYLAVINFITWVAYGLDKGRAKSGKWRIPERTLLLLALLPLNAILIFGTEGTVLYTLLWTGQLLFYLMAARGRHLARKRIKNRFLFIPYYFLFMNLCAVKGMNYLAGRHGGNGTWEKSRRSGHYAGSSPLSM